MCLFRKHDVTVSFSTLFSSHFCSDAGFGQQGNKCWPMFSVLNERIKVIFYCRFSMGFSLFGLHLGIPWSGTGTKSC